MIESIEKYTGGFCRMTGTDKWQVAYITFSDAYGDLKELKRHMTTDEVIIPVRGSAVLYTLENGSIACTEMKNEALYNIKRATWHHIKVSKDALLIVVEDSDVKKEFTERMAVNADSRIYKRKG